MAAQPRSIREIHTVAMASIAGWRAEFGRIDADDEAVASRVMA
jgi:hypothetical protein